MKTKFTRILSIILVLIMLFGINAFAADTGKMKTSLESWLAKNITVAQAEEKIDSYLDWTVFATARNGNTAYHAAYKSYIGNAVDKNKDSL